MMKQLVPTCPHYTTRPSSSSSSDYPPSLNWPSHYSEMTTHQTLTLYSFSPVPSIGFQPAKLLGSTATDPLKARDSTLSGQWQNPLRCPSPSVLSIPPSRLWLQPFSPSSPSPFARNNLTFIPLSPTTTTPPPTPPPPPTHPTCLVNVPALAPPPRLAARRPRPPSSSRPAPRRPTPRRPPPSRRTRRRPRRRPRPARLPACLPKWPPPLRTSPPPPPPPTSANVNPPPTAV